MSERKIIMLDARLLQSDLNQEIGMFIICPKDTEINGNCCELVYKSDLESQLAKKDEIIKELKRLYFYAEEMNYSIDDYQGISGEMRSRCVLYSDMEERNDCYRYAGKLAREVKKKIEELSQ